MIRMIATDLDGTLLRKDKSVSDYTLDMIDRARRKGVIFAVATARPVRSMAKWLPFIKFDVGIFHNGAVIRTPDGDIGGMGISRPELTVHRLLKELPGAKISVEAEDVLYCNFDPAHIWPGEPFIYTENFACIEGKIADKLIVEVSSAAETEYVARFIPDYTYAVMSENRIAMIMNRRATKINAVRAVAEKYHIDMKDVAAFGDDMNDIDMLSGCGRGVAVANALPEVKAAASETCASNMDDGVAKWIEQNILNI